MFIRFEESVVKAAGELNTHKARRTFGSTVPLKNGVSII